MTPQWLATQAKLKPPNWSAMTTGSQAWEPLSPTTSRAAPSASPERTALWTPNYPFFHYFWHIHTTIHFHSPGLHCKTTTVEPLWYYTYHHRHILQSLHFYPLQWDSWYRTNSLPLCYSHTTPLWTTIPNHLWPRPSLHLHIHKRTLQTPPNQTEHQYIVSPPNRWPVITHQPVVRTIPLHLWQLPSEWLGILATSGTIHAQLMAKHDNKENPFQTHIEQTSRGHQPTCPSKSPSADSQLQQIKESHQQAMDAIKQAQELLTKLASRFTPYNEEDKVWLKAQHLNTSHPSNKLAPKHYGPFLVKGVISHTSFQLQLPPSWKIHLLFHTSLLTPYKETWEHGGNFPEPPPDLIDGQPEWEVEQILGTRQWHNQLQYLIRWKGFSEAHDSWEPLTHINADHLIEDFHSLDGKLSYTFHKTQAYSIIKGIFYPSFFIMKLFDKTTEYCQCDWFWSKIFRQHGFYFVII